MENKRYDKTSHRLTTYNELSQCKKATMVISKDAHFQLVSMEGNFPENSERGRPQRRWRDNIKECNKKSWYRTEKNGK